MSHEIDTTTGKAAVFTVGTPPWHGLGQNVQEAVNSGQAIELAGLAWEVVQWPLAAVDPDGWGTVAAKAFVANVRIDTRAVLGVEHSAQRSNHTGILASTSDDFRQVTCARKES